MEEDGEIFEIDAEENQQSDFSMSSYDGDNGDILDIKPPQSQGGTKEKREKKKERHHRHKGDHSSSRHKSDRHRSRSDHRGDGRHPREKKRHREDRSESGRRKEHNSSRGSTGTEVEYVRTKEERSRKKDKEHHRGHERSSSHHIQQMEEEYYHLPSVEGIPMRGGGTLLTDPLQHHHYPHHSVSHRGREHYHGSSHQPITTNMSPERKKRMERMLAAEKQMEQSQKAAESRRQRKEEEKRVDEFHDPATYQRSSHQRPGQDMSLLDEVAASSHHHERRKKHKKRHREDRNERHHYQENERGEDNDIEVISENEDELEMIDLQSTDNAVSALEEDEIEPKEHDKSSDKDEEAKTGGSEEQSSDSTSSSSSSDSSDSDSTETEEDKGEKVKQEEKEIAEDPVEDPKKEKVSSDEEVVNGKQRRRSTSSTPGREGRYHDSPVIKSSPRESSSPLKVLARSPSKSPTPLKDLLPAYFPAIMGCRSVDEFECLNRIAEGTYGVVYRAREKCNDSIVALKRLKMEKEKEGFPITSLREINTLLKGQHSNIVTVREIVVGSNMDKIYIVMDYVEHDLKSLIETMKSKKRHFSIGEVKTLIIQLLRAVHHLHDNWILHRDLKTSNLLLSHTGILKVGDFGLAREYGSPLKQYTPIVVTLWYRAPELLLGSKLYSTAIDVWSVGCIYGELLAMEPMFPGKSEIDLLNRIFKELGTPNDTIWPGYSQLPVVKMTQFTEYPYNNLRERFKKKLSDKGFLLMNKFLTYNPSKRISCQEALTDEYFHDEEPVPISPKMFPTWPAKSEHPQGINAEELNSPKPPSGGKNFKDLGDDDQGVAGFFLGGGGSRQAGAGFQLKF